MSQQAANVQIAIKKQSGLGVAASGSGATGFNIAPGAGISPEMAAIVSPTISRDGLKTLDGLGSRKAKATYPMVLGVGTQDLMWPAVLRTTVQASFTITNSDVTSITTTTSTIVGAANSFLASFGGKYLYRGMRIKLSGHSTSANNGKWLSVIGVTASTITLPAGSLTLDATPDASFTITVAKCYFSGATPVESYYTVEEYGQDIATRETMTDAKFSKFDLGGGPNAKLLGTFGMIGLDFAYDDTTGSALFTSPTYSSATELELSDGIIIIDGVVKNIITDLSLSYDLGGTVEDVLGPVGNDVSLGLGGASGSLTAIRSDLALLKKYRAKTPFELFVVAQEPESDPADFLSFYLGNCLLQSPSKGIAQTGPMKDALPWSAGRDQGGSDRARTVMLISTSAA